MTTPENIGKYIDLELIGQGGFGIVYKAWDPDLDRQVAIKQLRPEFAQDESWVTRFQDEARFMARFDQNPNIVRVIEFQLGEHGAFMVMAYYPNGNLEDLIRSDGPFSVERALRLTLQIASGLSAAHGAGIIHRDIKPLNILMGPDFTCLISDFGVAASTDRSNYSRVGSHLYMSPEQKLGRRTDERADIYSLGVTLYQMLTGNVPEEFRQTQMPPDPRVSNPEISKRLVDVLFKAIAMDTEYRHRNIEELIRDLQTLNAGVSYGLERIGRYVVLETLAAGGQGTVYRARDTGDDRVVALKVMHPGHTGEALYLDALRREANLALRLDHANIVRLLDYQVDQGTAYIAMEYVPDVLSDYISPETRLPVERVIEIGRAISLALSHAHSFDVVHRDIKPQNILLTDDGTVKITDFGIARAMESSTMSNTGVMGTPFYMSPEQWAGGRVDGRSDVYSLGILLYELLTGSVPFWGEGMGDVYRQHVEKAVPPFPQELDVPHWLESVVRRALAKEASARFSSAGEMQEALEQALEQEPLVETLTAASWINRMPRWAVGLATLGRLAVRNCWPPWMRHG